jgi:hypothetical protein
VMQCPVTIRLLQGEAAEMRELQRVLEEAPEYAHRVTGLPPERRRREHLCGAPEGKSYDDKFVFGIYRGTAMVGCADVIRGYRILRQPCLASCSFPSDTSTRESAVAPTARSSDSC